MAATIRIAILANAAKAKVEIEKTSLAAAQLGKVASGLGGSLRTAGGVLAKTTALMGPLSASIAPAVQGMASLAQAGAGLAPVAAFLPGLAASAGLLAFTLKGVGPALAEALKPVSAAFSEAQKSAAAFAVEGLAPIGKAFIAANMPAISSAMNAIGRSVNAALKPLAQFTTTAQGVRFIGEVSKGTSEAFAGVAAAASSAGLAILRLAARADIRGLLNSLGSVVSSVLGKLEMWADSTSTQDIAGALSKAKDVVALATEKLSALRDIFSWLFANTETLKNVSSAISLFGIALGIATGNPITIAIAAFGLLINNWGKVKEAFNSEAFQGFVKGFKDFAAPIVNTVRPALAELQRTVVTDVIPALRGFLAAIQPIVKWLVEKLGPIVAVTFKYIIKVISGALKIVSGIVNIFSGIITGKWSLIWKGVKQILSGAWQAIVSIVAGGVKILARLLAAAASAIGRTIQGLGRLIAGAGKGIGNALVSAGSAVASGFLRGIRAGWGSVTRTVRNLVSQIPAVVRRMLGIASPSKVFAKIGEQTGQGLEVGLLASRAAVAKATDALITIPDAATARIDISGQAATARPSVAQQPVTLRIDSAGSALDDLLVETLRKSIRVRGGNVQLVLGR